MAHDRPVVREEVPGHGQLAGIGTRCSRWQVVVRDEGGPAGCCLREEHQIADAVGAGRREPTIYIWRSQAALTITRGQTHWPECQAATANLALEGWPVLVRRSGGGPFPVAPGTIQIAMIAKYPDHGITMDGVYHRLALVIRSALAGFGIAAEVGDSPGAFCDGRHDLVVAGRKIAGLAQHWRPCGGGERCISGTASVLVEADLERLAWVVNRFHAVCGQAMHVWPEAMTTVRDKCDAVALPQGDLRQAFLARLADAATRTAFASQYLKPPTVRDACFADR